MNLKSNAFLIISILFASSVVFFVSNTGADMPLGDRSSPLEYGIMPSVAQGKINIVGNTQLASFFGTNSSDGTAGNPYIIQGFEINANNVGSAIYIEDTDKHIIIQNCVVQGSSSTSNAAGIRLANCTNVIVRWNTILLNRGHGVYLEAGSRSITITGNTITANNYTGISGNNARDSSISQNVISGSSNITSDGINLVAAVNLTVQSNNISTPINDGIWLTNVYLSTISNNHITATYYTGISIMECSDLVIKDNGITRCGTFGLEIFGSTCDNNITHNLVTFCADASIRFYNGDTNTTGNKIWLNAFMNATNGETRTRWLTPGENDWDIGSIGNYWGDYIVKYPAATQSNNIWSIPYEIDEITFSVDHDHFPLVTSDLLTSEGPPQDSPSTLGIEIAIWILVIAFLAVTTIVVFKAYKAGVLLPWIHR